MVLKSQKCAEVLRSPDRSLPQEHTSLKVWTFSAPWNHSALLEKATTLADVSAQDSHIGKDWDEAGTGHASCAD